MTICISLCATISKSETFRVSGVFVMFCPVKQYCSKSALRCICVCANEPHRKIIFLEPLCSEKNPLSAFPVFVGREYQQHTRNGFYFSLSVQYCTYRALVSEKLKVVMGPENNMITVVFKVLVATILKESVVHDAHRNSKDHEHDESESKSKGSLQIALLLLRLPITRNIPVNIRTI